MLNCLAGIITEGLLLLLAAAGGGVISAWVTWRLLRSQTAQELLRDALAVQSEMEAWILDGPGYQDAKLSAMKDLPIENVAGKLWLRPVEVRAVLDEVAWNAPKHRLYGVIGGRRAWIVRDTILDAACVYPGGLPSTSHSNPALLSSRGFEDLCGWAERVAISSSGYLLSRRGLQALKPLLLAICTADRIAVLSVSLSAEAQKFLHEYAKTELKN